VETRIEPLLGWPHLVADSCQTEQTAKGELLCKKDTTKTANLQKGDTTLAEHRYHGKEGKGKDNNSK